MQRQQMASNCSIAYVFAASLLVSALIAASQVTVAQQPPSGVNGQTGAPTKQSPVQITPDPGDLYRFGVGDVLELRVYNRTQLSVPAIRIDSRGMIRIPMVAEEVPALCRTEAELSEQIISHYRKYIRAPEVDIFVKEYQSRPVVVVGAVNTPGRFLLQRRIRLSELLSLAGGPGSRAGRSIQVVQDPSVRQCELPSNTLVDEASAGVHLYALTETLRGDEKANPYVVPGQVVTVPEADQVYVVGNVVAPAAIPIKEPITVTRAIAIAGGVSPIAKKERVRIIRQDQGQTAKREMLVDLNAIDSKHAEDIVLQANDIVDVPSSDKKRIINGLLGAVGPSAAYLPVRIIKPF